MNPLLQYPATKRSNVLRLRLLRRRVLRFRRNILLGASLIRGRAPGRTPDQCRQRKDCPDRLNVVQDQYLQTRSHDPCLEAKNQYHPDTGLLCHLQDRKNHRSHRSSRRDYPDRDLPRNLNTRRLDLRHHRRNHHLIQRRSLDLEAGLDRCRNDPGVGLYRNSPEVDHCRRSRVAGRCRRNLGVDRCRRNLEAVPDPYPGYQGIKKRGVVAEAVHVLH